MSNDSVISIIGASVASALVISGMLFKMHRTAKRIFWSLLIVVLAVIPLTLFWSKFQTENIWKLVAVAFAALLLVAFWDMIPITVSFGRKHIENEDSLRPIPVFAKTIELKFKLTTTSDWSEILLKPGIQVLKHRRFTYEGAYSLSEDSITRTKKRFNVGRQSVRVQGSNMGSCPELIVEFKVKCIITRKKTSFLLEKGSIGMSRILVTHEMKDGDKVLVNITNERKVGGINEIDIPLDFTYLYE